MLGVLPGIIAMIQATEAIKLLTGHRRAPARPLPAATTRSQMRFNEFRFEKDPDCPVCGKQPTVTELIDYEGFCGMPEPQRPEVRCSEEISAAELAERPERGEHFLLLDVREPDEYARPASRARP